jgi:hypothetical protein
LPEADDERRYRAHCGPHVSEAVNQQGDMTKIGEGAAIPAFLLDKPRAAAALDMSLSRFDRFVYPHLKVVRTGLEGADPH